MEEISQNWGKFLFFFFLFFEFIWAILTTYALNNNSFAAFMYVWSKFADNSLVKKYLPYGTYIAQSRVFTFNHSWEMGKVKVLWEIKLKYYKCIFILFECFFGLNNRHLFLTVLEAEKCKTKVGFLVRAFAPVCRWSHCVFIWQGELTNVFLNKVYWVVLEVLQKNWGCRWEGEAKLRRVNNLDFFISDLILSQAVIIT